jgi:tRNA threonylcarbamoyladenosine biosynthesis protein TsaE
VRSQRPPSCRQLTLRTSGADETRAVAAVVAERLEPGAAVVLTGELGAGKTCFVQGAAAELGVERPVTSPTFTLVRAYRGDEHRIVHVDVYRLNHMQDFVELGEDTLLGPDEVTFVEWGDTVEPLLPNDRLEVELLLGDAEDERVVHLRGHGVWAGRIADLVSGLGRWLLDGGERPLGAYGDGEPSPGPGPDGGGGHGSSPGPGPNGDGGG